MDIIKSNKTLNKTHLSTSINLTLTRTIKNGARISNLAKYLSLIYKKWVFWMINGDNFAKVFSRVHFESGLLWCYFWRHRLLKNLIVSLELLLPPLTQNHLPFSTQQIPYLSRPQSVITDVIYGASMTQLSSAVKFLNMPLSSHYSHCITLFVCTQL